MKSIAWAIIIASLHMMPPPTRHDYSTAELFFGAIIFSIYVTCWAGFIGSLRSDK